MKFTPKTEEQISKEKLLPDGDYPFEIAKAVDKTSKAGNEMIELNIRVFKSDGSFIFVNDYLLESMLYKLLHAANACGLTRQYEQGLLVANDFVGKQGYLTLKTDPGKGDFGPKNVVKDYIKSDAAAKPAPVEEDDIQF